MQLGGFFPPMFDHPSVVMQNVLLAVSSVPWSLTIRSVWDGSPSAPTPFDPGGICFLEVFIVMVGGPRYADQYWILPVWVASPHHPYKGLFPLVSNETFFNKLMNKLIKDRKTNFILLIKLPIIIFYEK